MENLEQSRKYFSRLGLMYFLGTLIIYAVSYLASLITWQINPGFANNTNITLLVSMLPMYAVAMPLMGLLIRRIPAAQAQASGSDNGRRDLPPSDMPSEKNAAPSVFRPIHRMTIGQWFIALLICYAFMYISNLIGTALTLIIGLFKGSSVANPVASVVLDLNPWVSILIVVILAPIAEEIIFRGLLIDRTRRYGEGISVLLSGLMFGLFHGNLSQFAYAFTLGLCFGFIYVKTGKLLYTVLLHMSINFLGSVASVFILKYSGISTVLNSALTADSSALQSAMASNPGILLYYIYTAVLICAVAAGVVLFCLHFQKFTFNPGEITIPRGKRFRTVVLNIGMLLFCVFWIVMMVLQLFQ